MGGSPYKEGGIMVAGSNPANTGAGAKGDLAVKNVDISDDEEEEGAMLSQGESLTYINGDESMERTPALEPDQLVARAWGRK